MPTGTSTRNPRYAVTMYRDRGPRLANIGYFGHMWELYALWTWMAMYLKHGSYGFAHPAGGWVELMTFVAIGLAGFVGCVLGGMAADRYGRARAALAAMVISGSCCLLSPLAFNAPQLVVLTFISVWGVSVIADSGVFSTALSETADSRYVGTALTAQTAVGFLITVVTIQVVPLNADVIGWRYALLILAPGPLIGAIAMYRYRSIEAIGSTQEENHDPVDTHRASGGADGRTFADSQG
jgi:MFS family permease